MLYFYAQPKSTELEFLFLMNIPGGSDAWRTTTVFIG
jgi:hypothetical protein